MKDQKITFEDIDNMSAEEIRDLINTDFALFKAYWDGETSPDEDLHFYKTPEGFDVIVTGGIEDIEDGEFDL